MIVRRFCETPRRLTQTPYKFVITMLSFVIATEVKRKPIACQFCYLLQRPRLLEQVRRAGNNLQLYFAAHLIARHFV